MEKEDKQIENFSDEDENFDEVEGKRLNMPQKSKYRMRAHCNPLAEISIS
jgi:hypothetical protein